jgi:exoribonuclease II
MLMRDYMSSLTGMSATLLMDPSVAELLNDVQGFKTKAMLGEWLSQNVEKTARSYWGNAIVSSMIGPLATQGLEPYATWKKAPGETLIKPFTNPKSIHAVVVGGKTASVWFATDFMPERGASIDAWR